MKNKRLSITLSQAVAGYMLNIQGRRLSQNTINDYRNTLKQFMEHIGENTPIHEITREDIAAWLAGLKVGKKSCLNHHSTLSSMWKWLHVQGLAETNILSGMDRPRPERRVIDPLEADEIRALLACLGKSRSYSRPGKKTSDHSLPNTERNRAIILFMLDNGVRASELCGLKVRDLDVKNSRAFVFGKGSKERFVPFSARTGQAVWRYLTLRGKVEPDDPLFVNLGNRPITRDNLGGMLETLGKRAGVPGVHPHRLRHTFAINYLRAGGDIFTLQMILGHEELDMVRHYARIASIDTARVHKKASPVEFLRL